MAPIGSWEGSNRHTSPSPVTFSAASTPSNRKSRSVMETSNSTAERGSVSMPPPASRGDSDSRTSRRSSKALAEISSHSSSVKDDSTVGTGANVKTDTNSTPTLYAGHNEARKYPYINLPHAAKSIPEKGEDTESHRLSFSSLYSLGSAKQGYSKGKSATSSTTGSDLDWREEAVPAGAAVVSTSKQTVEPHNSSILLPSSLSKTTQSLHSSPSSPGLQSQNAGTQVRSSNSTSQTDIQSKESGGRAFLPRRVSGSTVTSSTSLGSEAFNVENKEKDGKPSPIGIIGVCALDSKARSKPSWNILNRLIVKQEFEVIIFGDKVILDEEVENWPICNFLISFFSEGFPLDKAIKYVRLRKPFCVNDLPMQKILWDRRLCLKILDKLKVPTPRRLEVSRDGGPELSSQELAQKLYVRTGVKLDGPEDGTGGGHVAAKVIEYSPELETLIVDGGQLKKPFVEKPVSGENHNINIYFSKAQGGGGRRLFRKINNKSSEKDDSLIIPKCVMEKESSYIYEQFLSVETAEDVKAYTVGPDFCHAETRKSPVVDGLVKRNTHGKEIRYITNLSKEEQAIASRISEAFGQRVCGFDLLRAGGKSYVIDVNGWSFVKDNKEYYDKCASILRNMFIREKQKSEGTSPAQNNEHSAEGAAILQSKYSRPGNHVASLKSMLRSPSVSKLASQRQTSPRLENQKDNDSSSPPISTTPNNLISRNNSTRTSRTNLSNDSLAEKFQDETSLDPDPPSEQAVPLPAPKAQWKLKGMVAAVRHADRTPKQKFKFTFHTKPFVDLLKGHQEEVLLIGEAALSTVLVAVEQAMDEGIEDPEKLKLLQISLVKKSGWAGTKVQIKPMFRDRRKDELENTATQHAANAGSITESQKESDVYPQNIKSKTAVDSPVPFLQHRNESLTGVTFSRISAAENNLILDKLQLIIKWGGEPTHSARYQAQDLGENLRNDLLLMNRATLDDVTVFTSSERRVTTSAQIFSSAFLDQKDLPLDYIKVRKDLLDDSNAAKDEMDKVKKKLKTLLREGNAAPPQFAWPKDSTPEPYLVVREVVELMKFLRKVMRQNFASSKSKTFSEDDTSKPGEKETKKPQNLSACKGHLKNDFQTRWCSGEDAALFRERWEKLFSEFCDADKVDPSKISELYDSMKFDALHNRHFLEWVFRPSDQILADESSGVDVDSGDESVKADEDIQPLSTSESNERKETSHPESNNEKSSLSRKIGFRRHCDISPAPAKLTTADESSSSYFDLFSGSGQSVVKTDARLGRLRRLYSLSKTLFDYIGPQEYGITSSEKLEIGLLTSLPLLREIVNVIEKLQASDTAKSFFYFTKESHIYTLLNCILEGGVQTKIARNAIPELDYLSHICFELYESQNVTPLNQPESFNYSIRITISPGCHTFDPLDLQLDSKHSIGCAQRRSLTPHGDWKKVIETLRAKFHTVKLPKSFLAINLSEKMSQLTRQISNKDYKVSEHTIQEKETP